MASGCLCYRKAVRTELDILHRPALRMRGTRNAWRATEPPPKTRDHSWNTAAAPGSQDNRTPPEHMPPARCVPETPQGTTTQPERQQCMWAPHVVRALVGHKDAGIASGVKRQSSQILISTTPKWLDDLCFEMRSSQACADHSSKVQENSAVPKQLVQITAQKFQILNLCRSQPKSSRSTPT